MGVPTVLYTILGGVQAVTWADVKQMVLVVAAIAAVITVVLLKLPVSPDDGAAHRWLGRTAARVRLLVRRDADSTRSGPASSAARS